MEQLQMLGQIAYVDPDIYPSPLFPPSKYYLAFKHFAKAQQPKVAIVLGVCGGGDCLHLCLGSPDSKVIGVDITYDHPEQLEHIKERCSNFQFWQGDSREAAPQIFDLHGPVDFLFIDTTHTAADTRAELKAWLPYLAEGAIVCFDDLFREDMEDAWNEIPEPKARMDYLHDGTWPEGGGFGCHIHHRNTMIPPEGPELGN